MKYYKRIVGKAKKAYFRRGYISVKYIQRVKTNDIEKFNKGLHIKFEECEKTKEMLHRKADTIYEEKY